MEIIIREWREEDLPEMTEIWNEVVKDGVAFPQETVLDGETAAAFFKEQTYNGVAADKNGKILGLYILHPNNVGRCGHICNASYAVKKGRRGMGIGRKLVEDSLAQGKAQGFGVLQFNAVVASNKGARRLYESLGFVGLGIIPGGFRMDGGAYEDICPYYRLL